MAPRLGEIHYSSLNLDVKSFALFPQASEPSYNNISEMVNCAWRLEGGRIGSEFFPRRGGFYYISLNKWMRQQCFICSGARFSKVPKSFHTRKAVAKSQTLWLQSCFIHVILDINRGSLLTRRFRRIHFSVFRYWSAKNGFTDPKSLQGRSRNGPLNT